MSRQIAILTHGDLDGMVSAILVMLSLPEADPAIRFTNAKNLHWMLRELSHPPQTPEELFITDIPLARRHRHRVVAALEALAARDVAIHLYDHHDGWDDCPAVKRPCATYRVDASRTTAAKLVHEGRCGGIDASDRWLQVISDRGESPDPWVRARFGLLVALAQPQHYDDGRALTSLARGDELSEEQEALSKWYYDTHLSCTDALAASAYVVAAASGRKIGWLDLRGEDGRHFAAPQVVRRLGVEIVVTIADDTVRVGAGSIGTGPDLTHLHGTHEIAGFVVEVAGHGSPVRIDPAGPGEVSDDFVEAVRAFLVERL